MENYIGKICPYCKTKIMEGDAVIVCPDCGMPHHAECWQENQGCTVFGCAGGAKDAPVSTPAPNAPVNTPVNSVPLSAPARSNPAPQPPVFQGEMGQQPARRFEILFESEPNRIQGNVPVLVEKLALLVDHQSESLMARCTFRSLTDRPIMALLADVLCTDVWGQQVETVEGFQFLDLKTKRDAIFGQTKPIPIPNPSTRGIELVIKKILYADRTMVNASSEAEVLPRQDTLDAFLGTKELAKEYARETNGCAKFAPVENHWYWRCACGAINSGEEGQCSLCGGEKAQLFSLLNPQLLASNLEAFEEEKRLEAERAQAEREEQLRQAEERRRIEQEERERRQKEEAEQRLEARLRKREKRKKAVKRISVSVGAVLLTAFLVYAVGWHLIPFLRYQSAVKALEAQSFDQAYETFTALGDFSDSADRAVDTLYQKGGYLMRQGAYLDAAAVFERVPKYKDSKAKAEECRKEAAYLDAKALLDAEKYKEAADAFTALGEYKDNGEQAKAASYLYGKELMEKGEYETAYTVFTALSNYEDSKALSKESHYLFAVQLFGQKKYEEAYTHFKKLGKYKDSQEQALEAKYLYGMERYEAEDYKTAVDAFNTIKNYKDVPELLPEAKYRYAAASMEKEDWKTAYGLFKELGEYKDSASMYKETYYQYGIEVLEDKQYTAAVAVFEALDNYKESKDKCNQAMYGYVLGHKDKTNTTTYAYLKVLKSNKYKDSKDIYDSLYAWSVKIVINTSEDDETTNKTHIGKRNTIYCHVTLLGGPPGETVPLRYSYTWPRVSSSSGSWDWLWSAGECGWVSTWLINPSRGYTGTFKVRVYNKETGELLGEATTTITN